MKNKGILIFLSLILVISIGSFREVIFVNLNQQISFLQGDIPENGLLDYLKFISNYSLETLILLKWVFTIAYCFFFLSMGRYVLKSIFKWKEGTKWYIRIYLTLFIFSGILYAIGNLIGMSEQFYRLSRLFMGALQSPVPLLIFIPLLFLKKSI